MSRVLSDSEVVLVSQLQRLLVLAAERERARVDLPFLVSRMTAVDQRDGSRFSLGHVERPLVEGEVVLEGNRLVARGKSWRWQRWLVDRLLDCDRFMALKGRQIGATWVCLAVDVAEAVTSPGTVSLLYRQREDDAIDNLRRWWILYQSLPVHLRFETEVIKPERGSLRPGRDGIVLRHPGGAESEVLPMTSAKGSGHGRSVRRVLLDESARIENLADIRAAVEPAAGRARIVHVSTANGRSNVETGEGNEFHRLWVAAEESGYSRVFLPYDVHPGRDQAWYDSAPEVRSLKLYQRQEQYPKDEHEAFALSDRLYFEADDLLFYRDLVRQPLYRADFVDASDKTRLARGPKARFRKADSTQPSTNRPCGLIRVFEEPVAGVRYAIAADPATGHGADYSAAYVLNLASMALAVEFHGHLDEDLFAGQLHYLGRMYGRDVPAEEAGVQPGFALLAVENAGGYGNAVIAALRDRTQGRPAYGNLYRHTLDSRGDLPLAKPYGFPMNVATRPKTLGQLDQALRERALPWVTDGLLHEMEDFVEHDHGTTPRAREGSHDDRVLACSMVLELYRQRGRHPQKDERRSMQRKRRKERKAFYPWQKVA